MSNHLLDSQFNDFPPKEAEVFKSIINFSVKGVSFFDYPQTLQPVIEVLFSDENEEINSLVYAFEEACKNRQYMEKHRLFNEIRSYVLIKLKNLFAVCTQLMDPETERRIRIFSSYVLSEGDVYSMQLATSSIFEDDFKRDKKPLSECILTLNKIAFREGFYLDPIKKVILEKLESVDPATRGEIITALKNLYATLTISNNQLSNEQVDAVSRGMTDAQQELLKTLIVMVFYGPSNLNEEGEFVPWEIDFSKTNPMPQKPGILRIGDLDLHRRDTREISFVEYIVNNLE